MRSDLAPGLDDTAVAPTAPAVAAPMAASLAPPLGRAPAPVAPGVEAPVVKRRRRWAVELGVLVLLGIAYTVVRGRWGTDAGAAMAHGHWVLHAEGALFDHLERPLNSWIVGVPVIAVAACYFYALMHYLMTPLVLLASRHRGGRQYWRGYVAIVVASAIALVSYAAFPAAPPRLLHDIGITDVMAHFADYGWWGAAASAPRGIGDATNQFAAMPSLHFGWSLWCAIQMWGLGGRGWRIAAVAYPTLQVLVVLATGNHFLLDVVGGALCVLAAYGVALAGARIWAARGARSAAMVAD